MPDGHRDLRGVVAARAAFLENGEAPVRDLVAASWRRSRSAGVDADAYRITYHDDVDLDSRLVRCAVPVIDRLAREMVDVPVAIALSDARARIVHRLDCSTSVGRHLDRVDFHAGFSFAEGGVGTNGIGTVFEAGASVAVVGAEHFAEALTKFACTGAPILDPLTGRVEGVLDVSSLAQDWTPLMHTLVRRAADDIGRNLLADRSRATQALFETFLRAGSRPRQAVMAVGDTLMVNHRAQQLFTPAEQFAIHEHARFLMARRDRVTESLTLASGRRVRIRATRILAGAEVAGVVLLLDDETCRDRPDGFVVRRSFGADGGRQARTGASPAVPVADGLSLSWVTACAQVEAALRSGDDLLLLGEPGTGKTTLVRDLFERVCPGGRVLVTEAGDERLVQTVGDAVRTGADDTRATADDVADGVPARSPSEGPAGATSERPPALVVLRRLDRADAEGVRRLRSLLASLDPERFVVAATLEDANVDADLPFQAMLGHFEQSVTLPPLRFRTDDLPLVTARLLRELAPDRRVRLHPDAARLVARYAWPGNLTELREALQHALTRRPVGVLGPDDLPAHCRTVATRTLTALETAERDAIVKALHACRGNRLHTAAALGMSRSSLYRKIRTYAITEA